MNHKDLTKLLQQYLDKYGFAVLTLDRGDLLSEEQQSLCIWSVCEQPTLRGDRPGDFPAKALRQQLYAQRRNKWLRAGLGVVWAVKDPAKNMVYAGLGVMVTESKAERLKDAGSERIFISGAADLKPITATPHSILEKVGAPC